MVGVSQGAGFSNAVMRQLGDGHRVYSIELGTMFVHVPRRLCNDHTLAIDSNGIVARPVRPSRSVGRGKGLRRRPAALGEVPDDRKAKTIHPVRGHAGTRL